MTKTIAILFITSLAFCQACKKPKPMPTQTNSSDTSSNPQDNRTQSDTHPFSIECAITQEPTLSRMEARVSCKMLVNRQMGNLDETLDSWHWKPELDNLDIKTSIETSPASPSWHISALLTTQNASLTEMVTAIRQLKIVFTYTPSGDTEERTLVNHL